MSDLHRRLRRLEGRIPGEVPPWEDLRAAKERSGARVPVSICDLIRERGYWDDAFAAQEAKWRALLADDGVELRRRDNALLARWEPPAPHAREELEQRILVMASRVAGSPCPRTASLMERFVRAMAASPGPTATRG